MAIKIIYDNKEVGYVYVKFTTFDFNDHDDDEDWSASKELDFIDTTCICEMHDSYLQGWNNTHQLIFTFDSMFMTVESQDETGEMIHKRIIPLKNIIEIIVRREDLELSKKHKMKQFSKEIIKTAK